MIVPDVNLLIYAVNQSSPFHLRAKSWLADALSGVEQIGLTWIVLLGFIRISTRAAALQEPLTIEQALTFVDEWIATEVVVILEPGNGHFELLKDFLKFSGTSGNLVADAHLAAIAIQHDATLLSADHDFSRFPGLRWHNPLA